MAFVDGQEYTGKNGKTGVWVAQIGCFQVVEGEVSEKYTAAEFGLEDQVSVVEEVTAAEE